MDISPSEVARLNELIFKWETFRISIPESERYCQLSKDLYQVRNAGWNGNPPVSAWPARLIDADDRVMAAVEHYFLCRYWVGSGTFPVWQMRAMNIIYDLGKLAKVTRRHNPNKPTTPPSALQFASKEAGIRDGAIDLARSGQTAPLFAPPPEY